MNTEDQMFRMASDWINSSQLKREFLKGKPFSKHKFNYWLKKDRDSNSDSRHKSSCNSFKEIEIPSVSKNETSRTIEITTPGGCVITINESC